MGTTSPITPRPYGDPDEFCAGEETYRLNRFAILSSYLSNKQLPDVGSDYARAAEPETMAWFAYSQGGPSQSFSGNGTVVTMRFMVRHQPFLYEQSTHADHVNLPLCFTSTKLANSKALPISHVVKDGIIKLYARTPSPDKNSDGIVNIYDVVVVATAYGSRVGEPDWNQLADIAPPWGKIDIHDAVTLLCHYGKTYP